MSRKWWQVPSKAWYLATKPHDVTFEQKSLNSLVTWTGSHDTARWSDE